MAQSADDNRTGLLLGLTWPLTSIAIVFVVGRFYCRLKFVKLWWDDWFALLSTVSLLAAAIAYSVYASLGGTKHYWALQPDELVNAGRANWISQPYSILSLMLSKVSVGLLILRLQAPCRWRTWTVAISLTIMCLYDCVEIVLFFTICTPTWIIWNPTAAPDWAHCLPTSVLIINGQIVSSYMGFMDLLLAALAVQMIWKLQMPLGRKIGISLLLGTGVIAFIFAILKVIAIPKDASGPDLLWNNVELLIWGMVEPAIVIVAACVPTLLPLYRHLLGKNPYTSKGKTSQAYPYKADSQSRTHRTFRSNRSGTEIMLAEHSGTSTADQQTWRTEPFRHQGQGIAVQHDFRMDEESAIGRGR